MTDRDRLAADLAVVLNCGGCEKDARLADRLITLGWTRLDDERLARALMDLFPSIQRDRWPFTPEQAAAAIAKAYREDTDA